MVELADGWWEAGETGEAGKPREELQRRALLLRAKSWYEKALPNLSGLDREAVLRQLKIAAAIK